MDRKKQLFRLLGLAACLAAALALLPLTLPVLLGVAGAAALDPLIRRLQKRTGMGRGPAAALTVSAVLLAAAGILLLLGRVLVREAQDLSGRLPDLLASVSGWAARLSRWLETLGAQLPGGVGDALGAWAEELLSGSGTLAQSLYERIFSLASSLLRALPKGLFFAMTMILSCCFAAGELPRLRATARRCLPRAMTGKAARVLSSIRSALGGWLRAQVKLMGVTFLVLTLGFLLLRVDSPVLLGLLVSVLDALPVLGTGTVLIPWALFAMLSGNMGLGLGLLGLYGAAALIRNILEPKLLGAQLGISPLLTLLAIYAGWRAGGFWGMLLLPVGVMTAVQLFFSLHPQGLQAGDLARFQTNNPQN